MTTRKNLSNKELSDLADKIRSVGRNEEFHLARNNLTNIHEAVMTGQMTKAQAMAKYPNYQPDKIIGTYKRKDGKTWNKTNAHSYASMVRLRQKRKKLS